MNHAIESYGIYFILILVGVLLYGIGNLLLGKKQHGGKRLVILVVGICMLFVGGLITSLCAVFGNDGTNLIFVCLLFAAGVALVGVGGYAAWLSFSGDNAKIEKVFDSLLGGL